MVVGVDGNKRAELERVEDRLHLGNPKKKKFFSLVFRSICTISDFIEDRLHLGNPKKKKFFSLVFRSICTIFVGRNP